MHIYKSKALKRNILCSGRATIHTAGQSALIYHSAQEDSSDINTGIYFITKSFILILY